MFKYTLLEHPMKTQRLERPTPFHLENTYSLKSPCIHTLNLKISLYKIGAFKYVPKQLIDGR